MPRGPVHQRLADYVDNADPDALDDAATQWRLGMELLGRVSRELHAKATGMKEAESYSDGAVWSGATASSAREAFTKSSTAMHEKSTEMQAGSNAFTDAATGVRDARHALRQLDSRDPGGFPSAPPVTPGPSTKADERAKADYTTAVNGWWADYNANETAAGTAIKALEHNHTTQAQVFQRIHGETPPSGGGGGGTGNPVTTGTAPAITHQPSSDPTKSPVGTVITDTTHHTPHLPPVVNVPPPVDNPVPPTHHTPVVTDPGVPQGPGTTGGPTVPTGPGGPGGIGALGGGVGTAAGGGVGALGGVGAVAGGALGGAAAAGLAAGGLNGGLNGMVPMGGAGVRGGLSASGVRGIGATSRTGVGSVLGRGTGTTGRAGTGGMAGRNGGRGSSRSGGTRGSRGRAGSRGAGAGGSGRNGKDKRGRSEERDLFDDGSDWIDDEDIAPGLLD